MKDTNSTYINDVSDAFVECKKLYTYHFEGSKLESSCINENKRQQYIQGISYRNAPVRRLYDKIVDYYEGDDLLIKEVDIHLSCGNLGYFELSKNVYLRQYRFMQSEFSESLEEFIRDEIDCRELVVTLENDSNALTDVEFLKAIRFQIIQIYRWLEELYALAYPSYDQLLLGERHVTGLPATYKYIRLSYGDKRNEVMKQVYDGLNGHYFDITYEDFKRHFQPPAAFKKITWLGSLNAIVLLFYGKADFKGFGTVTKLHVINNQTSVITDHFVKADGSNFSPDSIASQSQNIEFQKTIRNADRIVSLLLKINNSN